MCSDAPLSCRGDYKVPAVSTGGPALRGDPWSSAAHTIKIQDALQDASSLEALKELKVKTWLFYVITSNDPFGSIVFKIMSLFPFNKVRFETQAKQKPVSDLKSELYGVNSFINDDLNPLNWILIYGVHL